MVDSQTQRQTLPFVGLDIVISVCQQILYRTEFLSAFISKLRSVLRFLRINKMLMVFSKAQNSMPKLHYSKSKLVTFTSRFISIPILKIQ